MVVRCTQNATRRQQFHVAPVIQRCKYSTSFDIQKHGIKLVTHVEAHAGAVSLLESGK